MPCRSGIHLADHPQHIVQRGHRRTACFFAEADDRFCLHGLKPGAAPYGSAVNADQRMTHPVHRLLTPDAPNGLPQGMQSPGRRDARYVNRCCKRSGSIREAGFKSSLIRAGQSLELR